jgi:hypothetical protein
LEFEQCVPFFDCATQIPAGQYIPEMQSESTAQLPAQIVPLQW